MLTEAEAKAKEFAEGRIRAVLGKQKEVDAELQKLVTNWEPGRLAPVDRAILRVALWEMKFAEDVPPDRGAQRGDRGGQGAEHGGVRKVCERGVG